MLKRYVAGELQAATQLFQGRANHNSKRHTCLLLFLRGNILLYSFRKTF